MSRQVWAVIVNYRCVNHTLTCLRSLENERLTFKDADLKCVVVDNHSLDDSITKLNEFINSNDRSSWIDLISENRNLGFGVGNNTAIHAIQKNISSKDDVFYLIVNPDTEIKHALCPLFSYLLNNRDVGIVAPQLLNTDGSKHPSGFRFPSLLNELTGALGFGLILRRFASANLHLSLDYQAPRSVDWVSGAALLLRGKAAEQTGLFDPNFFLYFEEVDLCKRMKDLGWHVVQEPGAQVIHLRGASTGQRLDQGEAQEQSQWWFRSRRYYFAKHYGRLYRITCDGAVLLALMLRITLEQLRICKVQKRPKRYLRDFFLHSVTPQEPQFRVR